MFRRTQSIFLFLMGLLLISSALHPSLAEKPQVWRRLRSPNFIVVTNASEKQARQVAYHFELIRAIFREIFSLHGSSPDPPVIIIAAKDDATLLPLLPDIYREKKAMHPAGLYMGGPEKNYVALRLDVTMGREAYEPFEAVYHEYVHYLMRRSLAQLPLWLTEGLAEFYGNTRLDGKTVIVGAPSDPNLIVLHQEQLLPLRTLFGVNASSPYYHENNKVSIFYAESWALTHFLVTRDWRENTHLLTQFVGLLEQSKSQDEAAKHTVGDPAALDDALRKYIGRFSFTVARFPAPPGVDEDAYTPEPISDAESLAVRADFLVHAQRYADARQMLEEALKVDPKLAAAYESMGLLYAQQNNTSEANKWYAQAVALNSQSYLAHYYYATNLFKSRLDDDTAAKAESSLRTSIKINAGFAPAYSALAYLLASRHSGSAEARSLLLQAITLEPGNVHLRVQMVSLLVQADDADNAMRVARVANSMAKTIEEEAEAQSALESAQQFKEYKQRLQEQQEAFKKAQAQWGSSTSGESVSGPVPVPSREAPSPGESSSSEETKPPELRHRDEASVTATHRLPPAPLSPTPPQRPELLIRSELVEGKIADGKCSGSATLELTVTTSVGTLQLYSDNYFKIPYSALNFTPQGLLNPCSDMKGMRARITYHPAKDQPKAGEIAAVQLMK